MLRVALRLVALLALVLPLLAAPALATYPTVGEPFHLRVVVPGPGHDMPLGFGVESVRVPEQCVHRQLFCAGPYESPPLGWSPGDEAWMWVMLKDVEVDVAYNQSQMATTGPWYVNDPHVGRFPVCRMGCFVPVWANATVHTGYMATVYDDGYVVNEMGVVHVDSWTLLEPYVRRHDPESPRSHEVVLPEDTVTIVRSMLP